MDHDTPREIAAVASLIQLKAPSQHSAHVSSVLSNDGRLRSDGGVVQVLGHGFSQLPPSGFDPDPPRRASSTSFDCISRLTSDNYLLITGGDNSFALP